MTDYKIVYRDRAEAFGNYKFDVLVGTATIFQIEYTYNGDEHFMRVPNGEWISTDRLVDGGGPEPLRLNSQGLAIVAKVLAA